MPEEANNYLPLREAGIDEDDALRIASDAAWAIDRNRKKPGSPNGALGTVAIELYDKLIEDPTAFFEFQPFTIDEMAKRLVRSDSAVGSAAKRLIEHGFIEKRREGRSFAVKAHIPSLALTEAAEDYLKPSEPGTGAYEVYRPLGKIVIGIFPRN